MSKEENITTVLKAYDFSSKKNTTALYELYDPNYIEHTCNGDFTLEQIKKTTEMFFQAFPDSTFTVKNLVAEDDKVAYQVTIKGTHQGMFIGIPPTCNKIEMLDTSIKRIKNGKFIESWGTIDTFSLMEQLGVIPKKLF